MKKTLLIVALLITLGLQAQKKTNVILFLVDDLGYYDLSCTGSKLYDTPNIDRLADDGMLFTNAYASHPRCVPSRYGIQTGKYPATSQVPGGRGALKQDDKTIGMAFHEAGYRTFFAGKWHLGKHEDLWPQNRGYDVNIAGCSAGAPISYFAPYNVGRKGAQSDNHHRAIVGLDDAPEGEYITDRLTTETIKFIKENKDKPFFVMLSHYGVHTPFQAKKEILEKYKTKLAGMTFEGPDYIAKDGTTKMHQDNAIYAAMIESVDESLGNLIAELKKDGLYENTAIIFTSDHGGLSNRGANSNRELATSNLPLRGGKGHLYEGGIKVPFIVYWNGTVKAGSISSQVTSNVDIYPTLLAIAGIENTNKEVDGISIVPALDGKAAIRRTLYWHSPKGRPNKTGDHNCSVVREGDYKLLDFYDTHHVELYNLKKDPSETNNLATEKEKKTKELLDKLNAWKKDINAYIDPDPFKKNKKKNKKNKKTKNGNKNKSH